VPGSLNATRSRPPAKANAVAGGGQSGWPRIGAGKTLTQQVYEAVRERILSGELAPRAAVREDRIGKAVGVSRTPVREALNRLASEGFLERRPHRGFRVPERSLDDLIHLYQVLQALELLAAELAFPKLTGEDLARLEEANAGFAAALRANEVEVAVERNDRFHHLLSELSGNPVLCSLLDDLRAQVRRLEVLDFTWVLGEASPERNGHNVRDNWVAQHTELIAAARAREFDRARELLRTNRSLVFQAKLQQAGRARRDHGTSGGVFPSGE
jgi:DNA-binding GntR family transcriptional regulator